MENKIKVCGKLQDGTKEVCVEATRYKVIEALDDEDIADAMFGRFNSYGRGMQEAISKKLLSEHNTIQQTFFRSMNEVVKDYSIKTRYFDARNEGSKKWADAVVKATEDIHLPFI